MKKKKGGIGNAISQMIMFVIVAGLFIALLSRFDWDIIELFYWIGHTIWEAILTVADFFAGNTSFQKLTT